MRLVHRVSHDSSDSLSDLVAKRAPGHSRSGSDTSTPSPDNSNPGYRNDQNSQLEERHEPFHIAGAGSMSERLAGSLGRMWTPRVRPSCGGKHRPMSFIPDDVSVN